VCNYFPASTDYFVYFEQDQTAAFPQASTQQPGQDTIIEIETIFKETISDQRQV